MRLPGGSHPDNCRLIWKLASGSAGQLAGPEPRDKGDLGLLSDTVGRNACEARAGLERANADADPDRFPPELLLLAISKMRTEAVSGDKPPLPS